MASDLLKMAFYEFDPECPLIVQKANSSLELLMSDLEEDPSAPKADLTAYPTREQCKYAGERGLRRAQEDAVALGMDNRAPRPQWFNTPSMDEARVSSRMRDADADDNVVERIVDPVTRRTVAAPEREVGECADDQRDFVAEQPCGDGPPTCNAGAADSAAGDAGADAAAPTEIPRRPAPRAPNLRSRAPRNATMVDDGDHEDAVRGRHELRDVGEEVEAALAESTGDAAAASPRVCCKVTAPDGTERHKSTVNTELAVASSKGNLMYEISSDRLVRQKQRCADPEPDAADDDAPDATRMQLQRGADIAQAFLNDKGDAYYFLLGRVQAMYSNASGSFKAVHSPIDLSSNPAGIKHVCRWYSRVCAGGDAKWTYDTDDVNRYHADFTLSVPELKWNEEADQYHLSASDRAAIKTALLELKSSL